MRTVVVSDAHIGYERSDAVALENFLDGLLANPPDRLILLGDVFDFWRRSDVDLLIQNQSVVGKLLRLPLSYVYGNHDYSMLKLSRRFPEQSAFEVKSIFTLETQRSRFVMRHGYELEVLTLMETVGVDAYEAFSEAMCHSGQLGGSIASWIWEFVELVKGNLSASARTLLEAASKPAEIRPHLHKVDEFARSPSRAILLGLKASDVLVFGHTHRPFKDEHTVNTGSWVMTKNKNVHTYVEITDQSFELKTWPASALALKAALRYKPLIARPLKKRKRKSR